MRQRKLEFDRKAKEKWGNVSDKLAGTTKRGGKAKKTAGGGLGGMQPVILQTAVVWGL